MEKHTLETIRSHTIRTYTTNYITAATHSAAKVDNHDQFARLKFRCDR